MTALPDNTNQQVIAALGVAGNAQRNANLWQTYLYDRDLRLQPWPNLFASDLVRTRAVGWLIIYAPNATVRDRIFDAIYAIDQGIDVFGLGLQQYLNGHSIWNLYFLLYMNLIDIWRSVAAPGRVLPQTLAAQLPPNNNNNINLNWNTHGPGPLTNTIRGQILARDDYRCRASGRCDTNAYQHFQGVINLDNSVILQIAHIIPHKLGGNGVGNNRIWATLQAFGYVGTADIQALANGGTSLNDANNLFSLSSDRHSQFDRMMIWFDHTGMIGPNDYEVKFGPIWKTNTNGGGRQVDLNNPANLANPIDAPKQEYLGLHAASAKAYWLSGAADVFLKAEQDPDDMDAKARCDALTNEPTESVLEAYTKWMTDQEAGQTVKPIEQVGRTTIGGTPGEMVKPVDLPRPTTETLQNPQALGTAK